MATLDAILLPGIEDGTQINDLAALTASADVDLGVNSKFSIIGTGAFNIAFSSNATGPNLTAASQVWQFDDSAVSYVDITTAFNNATTGDTNPWPAVEASPDRMYIGSTYPIRSLRFIISTAGVGGTLTWKYYNGSWTALDSVSDGTNTVM